MQKRTAPLSIMLIVLVMGAVWLTARAQAQNTKLSGFRASGMVGLATGQTLRLNAVSVNVGHDVPVELLILNGHGNVVARIVDRLAPGQATFLDFRFPTDAAGNRVQVRALVRWGTSLGAEGYIIPTLETVDDITGRTIVLEPNFEA